MLAAKAAPQTFLSQLKILNPSRIPTGIRLKTAINPFKNAANNRIPENGFGTIANPKRTTDRKMFVTGPARETFPISSVDAELATIIAPREIILNNGLITEINVKIAPHIVNRNSAHNPLL